MSGIDVSAYGSLTIAPQVVFERADEHPDRARFHVPEPCSNGGPTQAPDWRVVTWRGFADRIADFAHALNDRGVQPGDRVALFGANSVDWAAAALGAQAQGAVMVPIYASSTVDQVRYVVEHAQARVLLLGDDSPITSGWGTQVVPLASVVAKPGRSGDAGVRTRLAAVGIDDVGMMLYTSGTSGPPKGVPLTHRNVGVNGRDWLECNAPGLHDDAVDLLWLPMSHVFGFGEMCLGNILGFTTWMSSPQRVLDDLREVRPTVFMSVPSLWEKMAQAASEATSAGEEKARLDEATGGRLRFCLSGGAGLEQRIKELYERCGVLLLEGYGLTEASPTLTLNRPDDYRFDSVGKPLPSVRVRLADDGEILAQGESIFGGYFRDEAASAQAFTDDGWLRTGDLGRWTDDGFLQIVGRKKEILVTAGGKNVAPANIELRFQNDPLIEHVLVYGDGRKYLVAGVWLRPEAPRAGGPEVEAAVQARIDAVNATLPRHETVKKWALLEPSPSVENGWMTPTLKLKRKALSEAFAPRLDRLYEAAR